MSTIDSKSQRTEAQKESSRRNSQKSTGPRSEPGKRRSSRNALKTGMYSSEVLLSNDNPDDYTHLLDSYAAEWNPVGQSETDLLIEMVDARWRGRRMKRLDTAAI